MTKKEKIIRDPKVGETWLVDSFAGVEIKKRITKADPKGSGWFGVLIDEEDAIALRNASVPYIEIDSEETYIFKFHLIKRLKAVPRKKKNGSSSNRQCKRNKKVGAV